MAQRLLPISHFLRVTPLHAVQHHWSAAQESCGFGSGKGVFWLITEGSVEISTARRTWNLEAGHAFLFAFTGERRVYTPRGAQWLSLGLRASAYETLDLLSLLQLPSLWKPDIQAFDAIRTSCQAIVKDWGAPHYAIHDARTFDTYLHHQRLLPLEGDTTRALLCEGYARALFALLWRQLATQSLETAIGTHFPAWLPLALARMRDNPGIGVEELARSLGLSRRHLLREFKKHFGFPPREFMNRRRLEEACQLLQSSELPLSEIARQTGFAELSHFHRAFKAAYEVTPDAYRIAKRLEIHVI